MKPHNRDWISSLVVFIVAIPLSLGISLASGVPLMSGMIAAITGGVVVGLLSGAPLSVSGPAAGLTVLVYGIVQQHGVLGLAIVTLMTGALQMLMAALRVGRVFALVPEGVLKGMLAAIGAIITLGQMHILMGAPMPSDPATALARMPASLQQSLQPENPGLLSFMAPVLFCGLIAIAIQYLWKHVPRKIGWLPAPLAAVLIVTPLSLLWPMSRIELDSFGSIIGSAAQHVVSLSWLTDFPGLLLAALGLTLVASAESLLTARAVDLLQIKRDGSCPPAQLNRELMAQGAGNFLSGFLGGLPITSVIVRSAANIDAGAKTRWSTILHGTWILLAVLFFAQALEFIPLTVLASILIVTGIKLLNPQGLIQTWQKDRMQATHWIVTLVAILATNLLTGLAIGLGWAAVATLIQRKLMRQSRVAASAQSFDSASPPREPEGTQAA